MKKFLLTFIVLASTNAWSATHYVKIGAMKFIPENITVKVGDKIVWTNRDIGVHSVTSTNKLFDSGSVRPKKKWTYTVSEEGEFPYKCLFHTGMTGVITARP